MQPYWDSIQDDQPVQDDCASFISDIDYNGDNGTAVLFGTETVNLTFMTMNTDGEGRLHGECIITLGSHRQSDPTSKWIPKHLVGQWIHGVMDGLVLVDTPKGQQLFAIVRQDCLHGPALLLNTAPVLPVRIFSNNFRKTKNIEQAINISARR